MTHEIYIWHKLRMSRIITTIYLDPGQREELFTVSRMTKVPAAAIIREAIQLWLDRRKLGYRTTLKGLSLNESGPSIKTASKK